MIQNTINHYVSLFYYSSFSSREAYICSMNDFTSPLTGNASVYKLNQIRSGIVEFADLNCWWYLYLCNLHEPIEKYLCMYIKYVFRITPIITIVSVCFSIFHLNLAAVVCFAY